MARQDLALEHLVLNAWKGVLKPPQRLLLAVSGGMDSMVMAEILVKWRKGLRLDLAVAHVHHGLGGVEQVAARNQARDFVAEWAEAHGLRFFTNARLPTGAKSEAAMRALRIDYFRRWLKRWPGDAVALAHHQEDLLETRLIRLIRGSGAQGLRAMEVYRHGKLRPLLGISSLHIREYARLRRLQWVEDPSNSSPHFLRNWLRREWLPSLETKRPGAVQALARSLEIVAPPQRSFDLAPHVGLRRDSLVSGSQVRRRALLAEYLKALGLQGYQRSHVEEILKRLSTAGGSRSVNGEFEMLGMHFNISPDFIWASRVL